MLETSVHTNRAHGLEYFPTTIFFYTARHLQFRIQPQWGRDDYFYMAFLPADLSCSDDPFLSCLHFSRPFDQNLASEWTNLEDFLRVASYVLTNAHAGIPMTCRLPPYPSSLQYADAVADPSKYHKVRLARQIMFAWVAFVTYQIAMIPQSWKEALSQSEHFTQRTLNDMFNSRILQGLDRRERCGMIIDMSARWVFVDMCERLEQSVPIWYFYPQCQKPGFSGLAQDIMPPSDVVASCPSYPLCLVPTIPLARQHRKRDRPSNHDQSTDSHDSHRDQRHRSTHSPVAQPAKRPSSHADLFHSPFNLDERTVITQEDFATSPNTGFDCTPPPAYANREEYISETGHSLTPSAMRQMRHENMADFFTRQQKKHAAIRARESPAECSARLELLQGRDSFLIPPKHYRYFEWELSCTGSPDFIRIGRTDSWVEDNWNNFSRHQIRFNSYDLEIDLCTAFAPHEERLAVHAGLTHFAYALQPEHGDADDSDEDMGGDSSTHIVTILPTLPDVHSPHLRTTHSDHREFAVAFFDRNNLLSVQAAVQTFYGATLCEPTGPLSLSLSAALNHIGYRGVACHVTSTEVAQSLIYFVQSVLESGGFDKLPPGVTAFPPPQPPYFTTTTVQPDTLPPGHLIEGYDSEQTRFGIHLPSTHSLHIAFASRTTSILALADFLLRAGIAFHIAFHRTGVVSYPPTAAPPVPSPDPNYKFTSQDYLEYVQRRCSLLLTPALAIAAFTSGGILWRLATESVQQGGILDFLPLNVFATHTAHVWAVDNRPDMVHYTLSSVEEERIIGCYKSTQCELILYRPSLLCVLIPPA